MNYDDIYINEEQPFPEFIQFESSGKSVLLYSSANFCRTSSNSNIEINIPPGPDILPGTIYMSPSFFIPNNTFNLTKPRAEITYPNANSAMILTDLEFVHDIMVQYKLTKLDGSNYSNNRELRCFLTKQDDITIYDSSLFANTQPDSGNHDTLHITGSINHNLGDVVKLKFNLVQDNEHNDVDGTIMTIFRISWNIFSIK